MKIQNIEASPKDPLLLHDLMTLLVVYSPKSTISGQETSKSPRNE